LGRTLGWRLRAHWDDPEPVKVNQRNRINTKVLDALMRLRMWARGRGGKGARCCLNFEPSCRMLELFSSAMYEAGATAGRLDEPEADEGEDLETLTLFADDGWDVLI